MLNRIINSITTRLIKDSGFGVARIFISYRRADSRLVTNRIYDRLRDAFGKRDVFKDVDKIPPGKDFRGVLREATANCQIMLVIIGPNWVDVRDDDGNRRLDNPDDFVRLEVETGLQRDGTLVIPVLVENARMPSANDLPDTLKELAYNNAFLVDSDRHFHRDVDGLIAYIRENLSGGVRVPSLDWRWIVGVVLIPIVAAIIGGLMQNPEFFGLGGGDATEVVQAPTNTDEAHTHTPEPIVTDEVLLRTEIPTITNTPFDPVIASVTAISLTSDAVNRATQAVLNVTETELARQIAATETQQANFLIMTNVAGSLTPPTQTPSNTPTPTPTNTPDPMEAALARALAFNGSNDEWRPFSTSFADDPTNTEMMLVPVGSFTMGSSDPNADGDEDPHPQEITEPFWIDRYEVTNADFARFLNAQGNRSDDGFEYLDDDSSWARIDNNGDTWQAQTQYADHPVTKVTWFGARDYCAWRGGRLPTEPQWEFAASGVDDLEYPWGDDWDGTRANHCDQDCVDANPGFTGTDVRDGYGFTAPVTEFENGQSWVGAYQMSGNVWEWVSSLYMEYPYDADHESDGNSSSVRVLRGGSWSNDYTTYLRAADRVNRVPGESDFNNGFRCARSYN